MDSTSSDENNAKDCKYDPMVQQNTLHKHLSRIVDTIEPQKKHAFLDILSNSLNSILSCFKCKSTLRENSASFSCGHNYCEKCIKNLNKCTNCVEGTIRTSIRNFSSILSLLNDIKSNFNSDKIIYEMMRYLLMPQKFSHAEDIVKIAGPNVECTPCDSALAENVDLKKSRKTALKSKKSTATPSASKNSRKKLEFNKERNQSKNSTNTSNSDSLFLETDKNEKKKDEKKQSYLELQMPVVELENLSTPVSSTNRKRKTNESYLELQSAISEIIKTTPVSNNKRKRKSTDSESGDQNAGKSKRPKTKTISEDSLIDDVKSESRSLRKRTPGQKLKSTPLSSDSPKQGEENQQNVTQQKLYPLFNAIKSTPDEVKTPFIPSSNVDTDVLDLDVWKRNDKYEKKKNLFKSVKERNKRSISIGGTLENLIERRTPKKQTSLKLGSTTAVNGETKKILGMDLLKDDKVVAEESNSTDSAKEKIEDILKEPVSKISSTKKCTSITPSFQITLQRISPKNPSAIQPGNITTGNIEEKKDSEVTKKIDLESIKTTNEKNNSKSEILDDSTSEFLINNEVGKTPTKKSQEIENPISIESISANQKEEQLVKTAEVDEPVLEEPAKKSREVLAEITDHQQNAMDFGNAIDKHKTPLSSAKSDTPGKLRSKLGLPLFPETNVDVFSQKGNLCSSTPCVGMTKKFSKTYSRAKNSLFNKSIHEMSPLAEERNFEDPLTFPDISPIVEKVRNDDDYIIISDEFSNSPKNVETRPKPSTYEDSQENVTGNTHVVVAEVHEVPVTPKIQVIEETPKLIQFEKQNEPIEPPLSKDPRLDEIIPMETDNVFENTDKVTDNILSKTSNSIIDLEDEIQLVDSDVENEAKRNKVKKLQESINNKTEKTFSSLKKNFNQSSSKLSVEKFKTCASSTTPAKNFCHFNPIKSPLPKDQKEINASSATISKEISSDYHDAPTQKRCTPSKSVACQTSPDLHLALLKQEFPHLFEKYTCDSAKKDYPLSVYDTPTEPINEGVKIIAKTPDIRLLNTTAKFTKVSSITSSEKKRADELFMDQSVLGDASFNLITANKTANISDYTPLSPQTQNGKKKLSCRLNFDDDDDNEKEPEPEDVPPISNIELEEDLAIKNVPDFTINRSNEIDFSDDVIIEKEDEVILSTSVIEDSNAKIPAITSQSKNSEDSNKTFFEFDKHVTPLSSNAKGTPGNTKEDKDGTLIAIPDTDDVIQKDEEKNQMVTDDEDDDIDFVAGTPTSQPRRLITGNLEKMQTPLLLRKPLDITLNEFSIVGNTTPNMSSVQPLLDVSQYSAVKKPTADTAVEVTPVDEPVKKREPDPVSLELFNSSVSVFSPAPEKILIATSGLKEPDVKIIKEFCEKFSATYVDKLTDESTHLVVKTNHKNRSARTFKYLQAIVSQVRIVSMKWIHECLTKEKLINEEKYIPMDSSGECGPLRTYHVIKGITPSPLSWLTDYCIYFTEPVPQECTLDQLQGIMRKTGAIVINSLREFKMYPTHHHVIIISDDEDCDDEYNMKIAGWLQSYEAVSLEFNWILEVIGRNRLMPFADFEVIEIPNEYLLQRNFPSVMLQSNEEDQNSSD